MPVCFSKSVHLKIVGNLIIYFKYLLICKVTVNIKIEMDFVKHLSMFWFPLKFH